jgi:hypothetical protein
VVANDGLDSSLIVHVHDELLTARGGHHIRPSLVSSLTSEEILHTKTMYPYIILRMCNECDIFYIILRLTHSSCFTRSALLLNSDRPDLLHRGRRRSGQSCRLGPSLRRTQPVQGSVPAQQAEDAIGVATMTPIIIHNRSRPVQVINKKY